jgi:hypothetical protein
MKDNDSKLIGEAYEQQVQEGALGDIASGIGGVGKGVGKLGIGAAGVGLKGVGMGLEGILKALNFLTAEQLQKVGDAAMKMVTDKSTKKVRM